MRGRRAARSGVHGRGVARSAGTAVTRSAWYRSGQECMVQEWPEVEYMAEEWPGVHGRGVANQEA